MSIKLSSPNYDDIVNKEKIKILKINIDEVNKIVNRNNIIHKKIQLWTNDKGNEYAICLLFDSDSKIDKTRGVFVILQIFKIQNLKCFKYMKNM